MKSAFVSVAVVFGASVAHVLLFLFGTMALRLPDEGVIVFLLILPALGLGVYLGATYGFVSLLYGLLFLIVYMTIGSLTLEGRQAAGAVRLGWEVEALFASGVVVLANIVSALPTAILRAKEM